jgi:hypothetical protein
MTQEIKKGIKSIGQNWKAKAETTNDYAEGKPSSESLPIIMISTFYFFANLTNSPTIDAAELSVTSHL